MSVVPVLTRLLVLMLLGVVLPVTLTTATAGAAVQPCQVTYSAPGRALAPKGPDEGHSWNPFDMSVSDDRIVVDVDLAVQLSHPDAKLSIALLSPQTGDTLTPNMQALHPDRSTGPLGGTYVFDDEAANAPVSGPSPVPGRYRPVTPATEVEGHPGTGNWSAWLLNSTTLPATVQSVSITLTFATCDSDGDGVQDASDNCPLTANTTRPTSTATESATPATSTSTGTTAPTRATRVRWWRRPPGRDAPRRTAR